MTSICGTLRQLVDDVAEHEQLLRKDAKVAELWLLLGRQYGPAQHGPVIERIAQLRRRVLDVHEATLRRRVEALRPAETPQPPAGKKRSVAEALEESQQKRAKTEPAEPGPSTVPAVTPADAEPTPKPTPSPPPAETPTPQPPIPSGYKSTSFYHVVRPAAPPLAPFDTSTTKLFLESMRICSVISAPAVETVYMQIDGKDTAAIRFAVWRDGHYDEKGPGQAHHCNRAKSGWGVSLRAGITSTKFNNEVQAFVHTFVADKHVNVVWYTRPDPNVVLDPQAYQADHTSGLGRVAGAEGRLPPLRLPGSGTRMPVPDEGTPGGATAVVTHVSSTQIDVKVDGWQERKDLPRTKALVMNLGGAGALVRAASEMGRTNIVEALIEKGVSVLVADEGANTPLHRAAAEGHADACRALLAAGADKGVYNMQLQDPCHLAQANCRHAVYRLFFPTLADRDVATQGVGSLSKLMLACRKKELAQAEAEVKAGADVNAQSMSSRYTALHLAAEEGDDRIVKMLLDHGANVDVADIDGNTPLLCACGNGHKLCARALIEAKAAVDMQTKDSFTALIVASQNGHELCARALIEAKAAVDTQTKDGFTALMLAFQNGHELCARALIEARANVDATEEDGWTALMFASQDGHELCARALIEAKAAVDTQTKDGFTALMLASQNGHELCARALIEARADLEKVNKDGFTALMIASQNGHELCARALIEAKAAVNAQNKKFTALMHASQDGHELCARALIEAKAAVDTQTKDGFTALMLASQNGHELCAQALMEAKANVDAQSKKGSTALILASQNGHKHCVRALIEAKGGR